MRNYLLIILFGLFFACFSWYDIKAMEIEYDGYIFELSGTDDEGGVDSVEKEATLKRAKKIYGRNDYIIPSTVEYEGDIYTVTGIEPEIFANVKAGIISIPYGVKEIRKDTFKNSVFSELRFGRNEDGESCIETIDGDAFYGAECPGTLMLPNSIRNVGFKNCTFGSIILEEQEGDWVHSIMIDSFSGCHVDYLHLNAGVYSNKNNPFDGLVAGTISVSSHCGGLEMSGAEFNDLVFQKNESGNYGIKSLSMVNVKCNGMLYIPPSVNRVSKLTGEFSQIIFDDECRASIYLRLFYNGSPVVTSKAKVGYLYLGDKINPTKASWFYSENTHPRPEDYRPYYNSMFALLSVRHISFPVDLSSQSKVNDWERAFYDCSSPIESVEIRPVNHNFDDYGPTTLPDLMLEKAYKVVIREGITSVTNLPEGIKTLILPESLRTLCSVYNTDITSFVWGPELAHTLKEYKYEDPYNGKITTKDRFFLNPGKVRQMFMKPTVPPAEFPYLGTASFWTITLYVPNGSLELYRNHPEWGQFMNILEFDPENMPSSVPETAVSVATDGEEKYYTLDGKIISTYPSVPGIYLRTQGGKPEKFVVK